MQPNKELARRKQNLTLISTSLIVTLTLIAVFSWWQMGRSDRALNETIRKQYIGFIQQGEEAESEIDYERAAIAYENALVLAGEHEKALSSVNIGLIKERIRETQGKKESKGQYLKLLSDGDALMKKGSSALVDAIEKYEQARSLNYNDAEVEARIQAISPQQLTQAYVSLEAAGDKFTSAGICDEAKLRLIEAQNIVAYMFYNGLVERKAHDKIEKRLRRKLALCS